MVSPRDRSGRKPSGRKPTSSGRISGREWSAIIVLLLLAFLLRTFCLTRVPPGLHNDEVVEIKLTETVVGGRAGIFFPEDTGHEVLYYYYTAPFVRLLGHTVFAMRLPAVFLSLIGMCAVWALARQLLGATVALTALAGFAVTFWAVAFGRVVLRVVMGVPLAALAAYCFWRARATGGWRALALWGLSGVWVGLAINAYTAARILPAIFVAFGVYISLVHRSQWRRWWTGIAAMLAVTAILVLPLFVYLAQHPEADQLGFFDVDRPLTELRRGNLGPAIETSLRTLGMFAFVGDPLPYYDLPGRPVFEPAGALLLAVGLLIALWRWRRPRYAFVALWFFMSLALGMLSQPAPNYTRTLGVQVVLFALPGIAVEALLKWAGRAHLKTARLWAYVFLALLFIGNLAWTARDYFIVWPSLDIVRFWYHAGLKAVADRLQDDAAVSADTSVDASPVAVCVPEYLADGRDPWWNPAWQHMRYLLYRPDLALRYYDCASAMVLIAGPARYAFPDVADPAALDQVPAYAQVLAAAEVDVDVLPDDLGVIVRAQVAPTSLLDEVAAHSTVAADQSAQVPVNFQGMAEFLGYDLSVSSLKPGDSFDLVTYWRVTDDLPPVLLQFTHVLDRYGGIIAQQDRLALTSASLRPGDVFVQSHRLTLPGDLAEGEYSLAVGLYVQSGGTRLQIEEQGQPRGDRLWLRAIVVEK